MTPTDFDQLRKFAATPYGRIAYVERGSGPAALFFHAALLNGYQWRDVLNLCAGKRRCIAFDNLGHGHTEITPDQPVDFRTQALAAAALLDALGIDQVDVTGNDSGGAIAQVFAATFPERVRTLLLTNCDASTNSPPEGFIPTIEAAKAGALHILIPQLIGNVEAVRSSPLGQIYEHPELIQQETVDAYLRPLAASKEKLDNVVRFLASMDPSYTTSIEPALRSLHVPTTIAWGTDDDAFPVSWAHWLAETIPGAGEPVLLEGAKLFWPEERPETVAALLQELWVRPMAA